jgi:hypothetical protein
MMFKGPGKLLTVVMREKKNSSDNWIALLVKFYFHVQVLEGFSV